MCDSRSRQKKRRGLKEYLERRPCGVTAPASALTIRCNARRGLEESPPSTLSRKSFVCSWAHHSSICSSEPVNQSQTKTHAPVSTVSIARGRTYFPVARRIPTFLPTCSKTGAMRCEDFVSEWNLLWTSFGTVIICARVWGRMLKPQTQRRIHHLDSRKFGDP